jgi:hypothetical protein
VNLIAKRSRDCLAGSANGMSINLLGLEEGFDIPLATLNVIKGKSLDNIRHSVEVNVY